VSRRGPLYVCKPLDVRYLSNSDGTDRQRTSAREWRRISRSGEVRRAGEAVVTDAGHARVDTTPLQGTWSATDETTIGLVELQIRAADNAALEVIACVAGRSGVVQLAETASRAYASAAFGHPAASAMTATIHADGLSALLTFYLKGEILVLDAFVTPPPGDPRVPHYARELFHRADADRQRDQASRGLTAERRTPHPRYAAVHAGAASAMLDIAPLAGEWENVNDASTDVRRVSLSATDGASLHWAGAVAADGAWLPVVPFAASPDSAVPIGFTARMTIYGVDAIVSSYATRGILVLDCHTHCEDGRRDHLVREFFSRPWPPR
jgi:hypothetical protein